MRQNLSSFRAFLIVFFVIALVTSASFAGPVRLSSTNLQAKAGILSNVYFQNTSGPGSSTPSVNTVLTLTSSTGSYTLGTSSNAYLWSPQFTSATTVNAGTWFLGIWTAATKYVYGYIPITITNSQSSATPAPFQVKITWNPSSYSSYEAANLGNIRFYSDSLFTTKLFGWLESCTPSLSNTATTATAWVRLSSSIAGSGGQATIYMAFLSTSTAYDANYWGSAPNLSGTYGQWDNGANVFSFYDNFAGTSLSGKWTQKLGSSGATITVNNGLTVTTTTTASTAYGFLISATAVYPSVDEAYTSSGNSILGVTTSQSLNGFIAPYNGYSIDWYNGKDDIEYQGSSSAQLSNPTESSFPTGIWQVVWSATASQYFQDGTGLSYSGTYNGAAIANYAIYIGQSNGVVASSQFRWARMRAYPPSNIMPSALFGGITVPTCTLSVSIYVTNSAGVVASTIASNVQSSSVGTSPAQYTMTFAGVQVTVPASGYLEVKLASTAVSSYTIYWGRGQATNFQVPYRILS